MHIMVIQLRREKRDEEKRGIKMTVIVVGNSLSEDFFHQLIFQLSIKIL